MGRGRGGLRLPQRSVNYRPNGIRIAKHLIVPEANDAVAFILDDRCASCVGFLAVLAAIDLDDQFRSMAGKVGDEMPDWNLSAKMMLAESLAEQTPKPAFSVGSVPQASRAPDCSSWRMTFQLCRPSTNITPP